MLVSQMAAFAGTIWEKLLEWYQGSVFRELINYFDETYFYGRPRRISTFFS